MLSITIESIAFGGKGVGRIDGKVYFVAGGIPGDEAEIEVTTDKSKFAEAKILKILRPSPLRGETACKYFGVCGGCDWHGVTYQQQLEWKKQFVVNSMQRIGQLKDLKDLTIHGSPEQLNYRNRIHVRGRANARDGIRLGYFKRASRDFVAVDQCVIADKAINAWMKEVSKIKINFSKEISFKVEIQVYPKGITTLVHPAENQMNEAKELAKLFGEISQVIWSGILQDAKNAPILEFEKVEDLTYHSSPGSFQQVNMTHNKLMREQVRSIVERVNPKSILDLFSGSGNFSLAFANSRKVHGLEFSKRAIEIAEYNCQKNQLNKFATYESGDAMKAMLRFKKNKQQFEFLITDPPREGMADCVPTILEMAEAGNFENIIYISCDPATLARDLGKLTSQYKIESIDAYDFFPFTYHVETLVHLKKA